MSLPRHLRDRCWTHDRHGSQSEEPLRFVLEKNRFSVKAPRPIELPCVDPKGRPRVVIPDAILAPVEPLIFLDGKEVHNVDDDIEEAALLSGLGVYKPIRIRYSGRIKSNRRKYAALERLLLSTLVNWLSPEVVDLDEWKINGKRRLRHEKKLWAILVKGGCCAVCMARDIRFLEFHHPGKDREYEAGIVTLSYSQLRKELKKVVLVCKKHHAIFDENRYCGENETPASEGAVDLQDGGGASAPEAE